MMARNSTNALRITPRDTRDMPMPSTKDKISAPITVMTAGISMVK